MKNKFIIVLILSLFSSYYAHSQNNLSVSVESNNQKYFDDSKIGAVSPPDSWGSNNYINMSYNFNNFSAGIRYEAYLPVLQGYSSKFNKNDIANKYISYRSANLEVTAGNFYEQYGNGLILRAYEERQLGIDNSINGLKLKYKLSDNLTIKSFMGRQRNGFLESNGLLRGSDLNFTLDRFDFGFSVINKYERTPSNSKDPANINSYSGRINYNGNNSSVSVEYVKKGEDAFNDLALNRTFMNKNSGALYIAGTYDLFGLNMSGTFRRLENMNFRSERKASGNELMINYVPALTKQHTYSLCNIYVYGARANSEIGYQFDAFYKFHKNTFFGGKYGTHIAFNTSSYSNLDYIDADRNTNFFSFGKEKFFTDYNIKITKKWSKSLKTICTIDYLKYNKYAIEGNGDSSITSKILVLDVLYKYTTRNSIRTEIQHLWTKQDCKNWIAALVEFTFAPRVSVFLGDDFNYGTIDKMHFFNGGISYTKNSLQVMISYGRTRGGLLCVGGVCRNVPSVKSLSINLINKF